MHLPHAMPTWTECAEKRTQGVHFARDQLVTDFLLVLRGAQKALGKNPGLVLSWKTRKPCYWAPDSKLEGYIPTSPQSPATGLDKEEFPFQCQMTS